MSPEDLSQSNQLRSHAMRVMGTVDKCLDCIHDQNMVVKTLHELGARHVMYTAKVDYMDVSKDKGSNRLLKCNNLNTIKQF